MAASSHASSSSYSSSSVRYPPSYRQAQTSPLDATWTPNSISVASAATSHASETHTPTPLRPLDLGRPGYQATITLFEHTSDEMTIYLGPWEFESAGPGYSLLTWECSYEGEKLEHYLPSDAQPLSLHSLHRRFESPHDMELDLSFPPQAHHVRYTAADGSVLHDAVMHVRYIFATFDDSLRFQSDLRDRELVDFFDVDVAWSESEPRTARFGTVQGVTTGQRLKLWRDRAPPYAHSLSMLDHNRHFREWPVLAFERRVDREDKHRRLTLKVRSTRRGSGQDSGASASSRRMSFSSLLGHRRSVDETNSPGGRYDGPPLGIEFLGLQFTRTKDFNKFIDQWGISQSQDRTNSSMPPPQLALYEMAASPLDGGPAAEVHADPFTPELHGVSYIGNRAELPGDPGLRLDTVREPDYDVTPT